MLKRDPLRTVEDCPQLGAARLRRPALVMAALLLGAVVLACDAKGGSGGNGGSGDGGGGGGAGDGGGGGGGSPQSPPPASSEPWVMGYVPLWLFGAEGSYGNPEGIDFSAMTHMIFCLLGVSSTEPGQITGAIYSMRAVPGSVAGPHTANGTTYPSIEDAYVGEAHRSGVKALIVIGGDGDSPAIGAAVAAGKRDELVKNVVDHMVALDFDGIDINWENSTPADVTVVRDFVAAMRAETARRARYATTPAIITYTWGPVAAAPWFDNSYSFSLAQAAIEGGADRLNVMTYALDYMNDLDVTWGYSNLYNTALDPNLHSSYVAYGAGAYADHGIPRERINVGIGFYPARYASFPPWKAASAYAAGARVVSGYAVYQAKAAGTSGSSKPRGFGSSVSDGRMSWTYLGQLGPGYRIADTVDGSRSGDGDDHRNGELWPDASQGVRFFDSETANSYLLFPDDEQARGYVSWEDPRALAAKAHFVRSNGYGGVIIWTTSYGNVGDSRYDNPFMDAVKEYFLGRMPADVRVTPAPASVAPNGKLTFSATVTDATTGAVTWSVVEGEEGGRVDAGGVYTAPAQPGVYHVRATSTEQPDIFADATVTVK